MLLECAKNKCIYYYMCKNKMKQAGAVIEKKPVRNQVKLNCLNNMSI